MRNMIRVRERGTVVFSPSFSDSAPSLYWVDLHHIPHIDASGSYLLDRRIEPIPTNQLIDNTGHKPTAQPHPSYRRLSRYDETGLIWLLQGREAVALTEATAAIQSSPGAISIYRRHNKHNKPALGPVGDCLHDLEPAVLLAGAPHDRP